jgi:hypothetical protein
MKTTKIKRKSRKKSDITRATDGWNRMVDRLSKSKPKPKIKDATKIGVPETGDVVIGEYNPEPLVHDGSKFISLATEIPPTPKSKFRIKLFKASGYHDRGMFLLQHSVNVFISNLDFNKFRDVQIQDTVIMVVYEE